MPNSCLPLVETLQGLTLLLLVDWKQFSMWSPGQYGVNFVIQTIFRTFTTSPENAKRNVKHIVDGFEQWACMCSIICIYSCEQDQLNLKLVAKLTPNQRLEWWQASLGSASLTWGRDQLRLLVRDGWSSSCPRQDHASTQCKFVRAPWHGGKLDKRKITSAKGMVRLNSSQMSIIFT